MPAVPHIAYLYSRYPVVSQTFCDTEMLWLEREGFRVTAASLNPPPNSFRHERLRNLKAEILYPPPAPILDLPLRIPPDDPVWRAMAALAAEHEAKYGAGFKSLTRARNAWYFARAFRRRGVGHVHVHFANRATHTALFLKKAGLPFSFTAHAQDFMIDLGNDALLAEMIREAEFTVAVSDWSRGLLARLCPEAEKRVVRIHNGMDPSRFQRAVPEEPSGTLRIISIGRLIDFKGFLPLLEAVALLRGRGASVELQIIGEGPQRAALEKYIADAGLEGVVSLPGVRSQDSIRQELARAHMFALACVVDGKGACDVLPTVILEAMAAGLPVVSTTLAGVPEMVIHGETGLLATPGEAAELAGHLETLAGNPELRARMGRAGRERVETHFSLEQTAGKLAALFRERLVGEETAGEKPAPVLALLETWPGNDPVLRAEVEAAGAAGAEVMAATASAQPDAAPPEFVEFLPDAMVLEAAWRNHPELAAKAEGLREKSGAADGELFFRHARRAVYLASLCPGRNWSRFHALRAGSVLTAWILHYLTGLPVSAGVEAEHGISRSTLGCWLKDFAFGSVSDGRLRDRLGDRFADRLSLLPAPRPRRVAGLFKVTPPAPPPADPGPVWRGWIEGK